MSFKQMMADYRKENNIETTFSTNTFNRTKQIDGTLHNNIAKTQSENQLRIASILDRRIEVTERKRAQENARNTMSVNDLIDQNESSYGYRK